MANWGGKTMQNTNISWEANNNNNILYFLPNSGINTHIDRMVISCTCEVINQEQILFSVLQKNGYKCESDEQLKHQKYKRIRIYASPVPGIKISIRYERIDRHCFLPCIDITIDNPDRDTIDWFDTICNSLGFNTTLSKVELAIDFAPCHHLRQKTNYE